MWKYNIKQVVNIVAVSCAHRNNINKIQYSEKVFRFDVDAPLIAKSRKAGNYLDEQLRLTLGDLYQPFMMIRSTGME